MKKRIVLTASILVSLVLLGGVAWAVQISRISTMYWEDPDWEQAYFVVELPESVPFTYSGTVRLLDGSGAVLDSQPVEAPGCEQQEGTTGGVGQCGVADIWDWETDLYPRETFTEEIKLTWIAPGYDELILTWVPEDCDLSGAGCTVEFNQTLWELSIPQSCRDALAACGTWQSADGWWFVSTVQGTEMWTGCLPGIAVGGPQ